jgi:antirestriction protein ArdC
MNMTTANNVYDTITNSIIAAIESGAGEFQMPWHRATTHDGLPTNALTGAEYRGSNILSLWVAGMAKGYTSSRWATYKQWSELGAQVRRGEKSTTGIYFQLIERRGSDNTTNADNANGTSKTPRAGHIPFARAFHLFNADQVDGYVTEPAAPRADITETLAGVDAAIAQTGARITHAGSRAFYRPSTDEIYMPERAAFTGTDTSTATESYYSTLLHELTHWTGHDARLARNFAKSNRFADEAYAGEELVAELGAAFLCARLGITNTPRPDHARYLASWLKVMKNDSKALIRAASDAQKAADYIINMTANMAEQEAA